MTYERAHHPDGPGRYDRLHGDEPDLMPSIPIDLQQIQDKAESYEFWSQRELTKDEAMQMSRVMRELEGFCMGNQISTDAVKDALSRIWRGAVQELKDDY